MLDKNEYNKIKHIGINTNRLSHPYSLAECIYARKWEFENERQDTFYGSGILEKILSNGSNFIIDITQRDAEVAATVIQWLGSNCGQGFIKECQKQIENNLKTKKFVTKCEKD